MLRWLRTMMNSRSAGRGCPAARFIAAGVEPRQAGRRAQQQRGRGAGGDDAGLGAGRRADGPRRGGLQVRACPRRRGRPPPWPPTTSGAIRPPERRVIGAVGVDDAAVRRQSCCAPRAAHRVLPAGVAACASLAASAAGSGVPAASAALAAPGGGNIPACNPASQAAPSAVVSITSGGPPARRADRPGTAWSSRWRPCRHPPAAPSRPCRGSRRASRPAGRGSGRRRSPARRGRSRRGPVLRVRPRMRAARLGIPPRRAEADEGRHQVHLLRRVRLRRQRARSPPRRR